MVCMETRQEKQMLTIIILLALLIVFDIAAMRWGYNSGDEIENVEWERRQRYARYM